MPTYSDLLQVVERMGIDMKPWKLQASGLTSVKVRLMEGPPKDLETLLAEERREVLPAVRVEVEGKPSKRYYLATALDGRNFQLRVTRFRQPTGRVASFKRLSKWFSEVSYTPRRVLETMPLTYQGRKVLWVMYNATTKRRRIFMYVEEAPSEQPATT